MARLFLASLACLVVTTSNVSADAPRVPVVVELFSSEGCSSCPPADARLERLDREQPIAGAEVIALELHVDYWNYLGWSDPFSQAAFSARQRAYARTMQSSVYTPQTIVDGSDQTIEHAARMPHLVVKLAREGDAITIDVGQAPSDARVMLATTERGLRTNVLAGENRGRTLAHAPIVRTLRDVGDARRVVQPRVAGRRVVVFVEARDSHHVLGAATLD